MLRALVTAFLRLRTLVAAIGLLALSALIWIVGPMVTALGVTPLGPPGVRAVVILVIVLAVVLVAVARVVVAYYANRRMIRSLLDTEEVASFGASATDEELERIRERFDSALRTLEEADFGGRGGKEFLQQYPWYVIIGPPGAGKTTILRNSGLHFPLADQIGPDPVAGVGGTRNCDWWFTDEAVLIDTAGRYTTQDSNAEIDRAAWRGFLELIRSHRRRRPINGVILAISLADVLTRSPGERHAHTEAIKRRLQELMRAFGMRLPVYVVVTKCDLVSGFGDFFDDLDDDGRAQIWGTTFPVDPADNPFARHFPAHFAELAGILESRVMRRLAEERSVPRRARIYLFPREFRTLQGPFESFFGEIFKSSRFETPPILRGLFLTSGTQEGTPLDRVVGAMSRTFGISPGLPAPQHGKGKAYFIRKVLTDVVFEEQNLVGTNRELERRLALLQTGAAITALAVGAFLTLVWVGAYARGEAQIALAGGDAAALSASIDGLPFNPSLAEVLPTLDLATRLSDDDTSGGVWSVVAGAGLSVTPSLARHADAAYDRVLVNVLLPAVRSWLGSRILSVSGAAASPDQIAVLRRLLQSYLMLGTPARLDRGWLGQSLKDEARGALPLRSGDLATLDRQIDDLVALLPQAVTLDGAVIAAARGRLTQVPQADKVYARLLREGLQNRAIAPVDLGGIIGATALQTQPDVNGNRSLVVPGVFTRAGFYDYFIPRLGVVVREEIGADWVTGEGGPGDEIFDTVAKAVADAYVQDYVQAWQDALGRITVGRFADLPRALLVVQSLAGPQSPLEKVVDAVRDNTDLPPPGEDSVLSSGAPAGGGSAALQSAVAGAAQSAVAAAGLDAVDWPGRAIAAPFLPLIRLVTPGPNNQTPPVNQIRDQIGALYGVAASIANAPQPPDAAFQYVVSRARNPAGDAMGALLALSAQQPDPVRAWLRAVDAGTWRALLDLADVKINQVWRSDVLPVCERALFQRFPFYASGDEVALDDFREIFKANGYIDGFYRTYLSALVAERGSAYVPTPIDGDALSISETALQQFLHARQIRDAFFTAREGTLYVPFSVRPSFLSADLLRATLNYDGREVVYRHEAPRDTALAWPSDSGSTRVAVTLTALDNKDTTVTQSGPWALYRLIAASGASGTRGNAGFSFSIGDPNGGRVTYELRAASVNNAFNLGLLRSFKCPEEL